MLRVALALCVLAGCGGMSPPPVNASDASRANIGLVELQRGRSLLLGKCGGCHRPPMPTDHSALEWPGKLAEMSDRAKIDGQQRFLIEKYLTTMAAR